MAITLENGGIDQLSVEQRLELIGLIWDSLSVESPPIPEWHRKPLEQRKADTDASPDDVVPWAEVRARLLGMTSQGRA